MSEANELQNVYSPALEPDPELKKLDRLVGTWKIDGEAQGQIRFEWMEGGFFLIQHVDLTLYGQTNRGMEVIGREKVFGAEAPSAEIKSRFYSTRGDTLDYIYELDGDTLIIWGGYVGSPAYFRGQFSPDGETLSGSWVWPGGGYSITGRRVSAD